MNRTERKHFDEISRQLARTKHENTDLRIRLHMLKMLLQKIAPVPCAQSIYFSESSEMVH